MLITLLFLLAGLAFLYIGGEALVWAACALARRLGVSPLTIGLTVVAFGTSMPELVVSLDAASSGANDISLGNVVGSNIANITLILGLAALIAPTTCDTKIIRLDGPVMIAASLLLLLALANGVMTRIEGGLFLAGVVIFTVFTFWYTRNTGAAVTSPADIDASLAVSRPWKMTAQICIGLILLIAGGHLVVEAAVEIASTLGMSQAVIGLTIVAVGTSLPELSTSIIAATRRQGDIAIGNVVGSNIFNILGILGVTSMVTPLQMGGITWLDLWLMVAVALALTLLLYVRQYLRRPEGSVLLAGFIAYTTWLIVS
ncbi:MAG: calcium/sodium antiporter [Pseudohongiellaceae bacterium]